MRKCVAGLLCLLLSMSYLMRVYLCFQPTWECLSAFESQSLHTSEGYIPGQTIVSMYLHVHLFICSDFVYLSLPYLWLDLSHCLSVFVYLFVCSCKGVSESMGERERERERERLGVPTQEKRISIVILTGWEQSRNKWDSFMLKCNINL